MSCAQAREVSFMKTPGKILLFVSLSLLVAAAAGAAEQERSSAISSQERLLSARVEARPGRTSEMYTVPSGMELVLRQACIPHTAMRVELGKDREELSFRGTGCTDFDPGLVVAGGESLYCKNLSGLSRNCMMVGMLRDSPDRNTGAQFIDVDKAIREQN
jgi:hypothetical protein